MMHRRARWLSAFVLAVLVSSSGAGGEAEDTTGTAVLGAFPSSRVFPVLPADGTGHGIGISKDLSSRQWPASLGGLVRILEFRPGFGVVQLGVGATAHTTLLRQPGSLQVTTIDFVVDFPLDVRLTEMLVVRTGYGHHSAHLADDGIELLGLHSINYAKDYVTLMLGSGIPTLRGFLYAGARYDFHSLPVTDARWVLTTGGSVDVTDVFGVTTLYAAWDIKAKSEVAFATTQTYQIGLRYPSHTFPSLRISWSLQTGIDQRGQMYMERTTLHLVAIFIDV